MPTHSPNHVEQNIQRRGAHVLDSHIDATSWEDAIFGIVSWGWQHQSRYVTLCNVHSVVTASQDPLFKQVIEQADLALPDGAPVAWAMHCRSPRATRGGGGDTVLYGRYALACVPAVAVAAGGLVAATCGDESAVAVVRVVNEEVGCR